MLEDKIRKFKEEFNTQILVPQAKALAAAYDADESIVIGIYKDLDVVGFMFDNIHKKLLSEEELSTFLDTSIKVLSLQNELTKILGFDKMQELQTKGAVVGEQWLTDNVEELERRIFEEVENKQEKL